MEQSVSKKEFKIIWAVDPNSGVALQNSAVRAIKALSSLNRAVIEPVYLLSTSLDSTPTQTVGASSAMDRASISEQFNAVFGAHHLTGLMGLRPLTVLTGTDLSKSRMAIELSRYAEDQAADVIVVASHGRTGIPRWIMGSFAESLMRESNTPLFITNPQWESNDQLKNIFFPTDFSEASKDAFFTVVEFARASGSPITLFHKVSLTISPETKTTLVAQLEREEFQPVLEQQVKNIRTRALKWAAEAEARGASIHVVIDDDWSESVADAILEEQKKYGGIIALVSHNGDTTRKIALNNPSAVWILYPQGNTQPTSLGKSA